MARSWNVWVEACGKNWRCRWRGKYGDDQKVFVFKADARELAEIKKREYQRRDAGLPHLPTQSGSMRVSGAAKTYLETRSKNPRKNTYIKDQEALSQFMEWARTTIGDCSVSSLVEANIYAWKDWLSISKKYSDSTVRMRLAHFRPFIKFCKQRGWITSNIAKDIEMPAPKNAGRVLTPEEIQSVYSICSSLAFDVPSEYILRAVITLLHSGMRRSEIIHLRKSQVERLPSPESWRLHFQESQTKNKKPKAVSLHPLAQKSVSEAYASSKSEKVFEGVTRDVLISLMRNISKTLGRVRLHDFKHTFCTYWMRQTGDIDGLQKMTGNSMTSLKIYIHLAAGTPHGLSKFQGFAPTGPLNDRLEDSVKIKKVIEK